MIAKVGSLEQHTGKLPVLTVYVMLERKDAAFLIKKKEMLIDVQRKAKIAAIEHLLGTE